MLFSCEIFAQFLEFNLCANTFFSFVPFWIDHAFPQQVTMGKSFGKIFLPRNRKVSVTFCVISFVNVFVEPFSSWIVQRGVLPQTAIRLETLVFLNIKAQGVCMRLLGSVKNAFQFPERQGKCLGENKMIIIVKK